VRINHDHNLLDVTVRPDAEQAMAKAQQVALGKRVVH
jgi:hypothetical protein